MRRGNRKHNIFPILGKEDVYEYRDKNVEFFNTFYFKYSITQIMVCSNIPAPENN